jgi:hypothetical protein
MINKKYTILFSIAITHDIPIDDMLDLTYESNGEEREVPTNIVISDNLEDIENSILEKIITMFEGVKIFDKKIKVTEWLKNLELARVKKDK